jgi:hypothetical protein
VDTGAPITLLRAPNAASDFDLRPESPGLEKFEGATDQSLVPYYHVFKTLTVGDITITNPAIGILNDAEQVSFRAHHHDKIDLDPVYGSSLPTSQINLGMDVLRKLHLYVAYGEKTLYVTAADAHASDAAQASAAAPAASQ